MIQHTCNPDGSGKPLPFGKRGAVGTCERCDALRGGAVAVRWSCQDKAVRDAQWTAALRSHDCQVARCGSVCTFGQW